MYIVYDLVNETCYEAPELDGILDAYEQMQALQSLETRGVYKNPSFRIERQDAAVILLSAPVNPNNRPYSFNNTRPN